MNARVFLIVVLTGLFMAVWNADQAAEQQFLAQRAEQRAAMAVAQATEHDSGLSTGAIPVSSRDTDTAQQQSSDSHFRPDGLAGGCYRAISEHGETMEFAVDDGTENVVRDFYIADSPNGIRWYFVRVHSGE